MDYVSNMQPAIGEKVTIRVRMAADAPVKHVLLWTRQNGAQRLDAMQKDEKRVEASAGKKPEEDKSEYSVKIQCEAKTNSVPAAAKETPLAWYSRTVTVAEPRLEYRFYLVCADRVYYYTQRGVTDYVPGHDTSFVLLTNYRAPEWVRHAVFYQIFPERFANGDPSNDVKTGEYTYFGDQPIHMDWNADPLPYERGKCMDFFGGDLEGIEQKIPYLKKLGVTAVYLNPIFAAPSTHKYDCIDYFHVDPHFGGDEALASLSKALHENGMKLMLDISINHTGTANRWFNKDGLFFPKSEGAYNNPDSEERGFYFFKPGTNEYKGWWDLETLPTLNFSSEKLRARLYRDKDSVLRKWLRPPYSIDGWRFDVADVMARNGKYQFADEVWPEICAAIREENPDAYIIAEDWDECSERQQGMEWDAPMNYYACSRPIREFYGEPDFYLRANPVMHNFAVRLPAEKLAGQVMDYFAKMPGVFLYNQFNLIDSHDVPRFHNNPKISKEAVRSAAIMQFALPGTPSVYYGDEAEIGGWTDANEGFRFPMPWKKDIEHTEMYALYQKLADLRKNGPALTEGSFQIIYAKGPVIAWAREYKGKALICAASNSLNEETVRLPLEVIGGRVEAGEDVLGRPLAGMMDARGGYVLNFKPEEAFLLPVAI